MAPATANTIGKFAQGIADDALSTLFLATTAPVLVAPAMNVNMFRHPAVLENLATLRSRGVGVIEPGSGYLACGWLGEGRLAEVPEIVEAALAALARRRDMAGETVLVTAGPDGRGHRPGPLRVQPLDRADGLPAGRGGPRPRGARHPRVRADRARAARAAWSWCRCARRRRWHGRWLRTRGEATIVAMAAAVSDYRPASGLAGQGEEDGRALALELVRTPDILRALGAAKGAAVPGRASPRRRTSVLENARKKLREKRWT